MHRSESNDEGRSAPQIFSSSSSVVSPFGVDYSDSIWIQSVEAHRIEDGFIFGGRIFLTCFVLGIAPYLAFLFELPSLVAPIILASGYNGVLKLSTIFLVNDCVVPGISYCWWALFLTLHEILVIIVMLRSRPTEPTANSDIKMFVVKIMLRLLIAIPTVLYAFNPDLCRGRSCFPRHGFAQLERRSRLKIVFLAILIVFVGTFTHIGFMLIARQITKAERAEYQVWWLLGMRLLRWFVRPIFLFIGHSIDKFEANPVVCMGPCYSILLYSIYFVIYREMLGGVRGIWSLTLTAALHAAWELLSYAIIFIPSLMKWMYSLSRSWPFSKTEQHLDFAVFYQNSIRKRSVEYGNRMFLTFVTLLWSAAERTVVNFSPQGAPLKQKEVAELKGNYAVSIDGIAIMVVFELASCALVVWLNRHRLYGGSFVDPWIQFIKVPRHRWILVASACFSFSSIMLDLVRG